MDGQGSRGLTEEKQQPTKAGIWGSTPPCVRSTKEARSPRDGQGAHKDGPRGPRSSQRWPMGLWAGLRQKLCGLWGPLAALRPALRQAHRHCQGEQFFQLPAPLGCPNPADDLLSSPNPSRTETTSFLPMGPLCAPSTMAAGGPTTVELGDPLNCTTWA